VNGRSDRGTARDRRSVFVGIAFGHNDSLSSNQISALWIAVVVELADVHLRAR
jgi:hypothetical protein